MRHRFLRVISAALLSTAIAAQAQHTSRAQKAALAQKTKLAKALCSSKPGERRATIEAVVASTGPALPWLLAWAKCPLDSAWVKCKDGPPLVYRVDPWSLFWPMAEIFGRLRVKEAIPYLIENIWIGNGPIRKDDPELHTQSPAIHALLQIGPDATPALLQALRKWPSRSNAPPYRQNHLGILIALAYMDDPRARTALEQAAKEPGFEGKVAQEGLPRLDKKK